LALPLIWGVGFLSLLYFVSNLDQVFDNQKSENIHERLLQMFTSNSQFISSSASMKNFQAEREGKPGLQREHPALQTWTSLITFVIMWAMVVFLVLVH
jgi:hypothetical protein